MCECFFAYSIDLVVEGCFVGTLEMPDPLHVTFGATLDAIPVIVVVVVVVTDLAPRFLCSVPF